LLGRLFRRQGFRLQAGGFFDFRGCESDGKLGRDDRHAANSRRSRAAGTVRTASTASGVGVELQASDQRRGGKKYL
jgi:hypothetical protein